MVTHISPKPDWFPDEIERDYWHSAQDIAFRAGASLILRDGATWLVFDEGERLVCEPKDLERVWFETWRILQAEYPELARLWLGGRVLERPPVKKNRSKKSS